MLSEIHGDIGAEKIQAWLENDRFETLNLPAPRHVRDVNIGFNEVQQMNYENTHYFEKKTPFNVALMEKINADLAIMLGLPVAPCAIMTKKEQPTMASLGLYSQTMSILQGVYKEKNLHNDSEEKLYGFAKERELVRDIMRRDVQDDLHPRLRPYRDLFSEMLPFLVWARVHDPNLSNVMDRSETISSHEDDEQRRSGYFIDLEGDISIIDPGYISSAEWGTDLIDDGDMQMVLEDWLAEKLAPENIFNPEKVWQTVRLIEDISDTTLKAEQVRIANLVENYDHIDRSEKQKLIKGLSNLTTMLIGRREQLADFMRLYIPEPAPVAEKQPQFAFTPS